MKRIFFILLLNLTISSNEIDVTKIFQEQLEFCDRLKNPKAASRCRNNILLLMNQHQQLLQKLNQERKDDQIKIIDNKTTNKDSEILGHFSNIANNCGKIVIDPHNVATVGTSICSILAEVIKIAATMKKNSSTPDKN